MRISDWSSDVCSSDLTNDASIFWLPFIINALQINRHVYSHVLPHSERETCFVLVECPDEFFIFDCSTPLISAMSKAPTGALIPLLKCRPDDIDVNIPLVGRSEEHTSELHSLMRLSYAVFCLKKKINKTYKP